MTQPRYLTKSRFKLGLECPTKLYYTKKEEYSDVKLDDSFLASLAKGGYQVGELAKCYFPGGVNIDELDYEISLEKTQEFLRKKNVIIYEAAFLYQNLFIRADIIEKKGNNINIYEVKAKSAESANEVMTTKTGMPNSKWKPYICDIAFQKYVLENSLPAFNVDAFLVVADKSSIATTDSINQKFLLRSDAGRISVDVIGDVSPKALGQHLLCIIPMNELIQRVFSEEVFDIYLGRSFKDLIHFYAAKYENGELIQGELNSHCRNCEFKILKENSDLISGFKECWTRVYNFSDEDFLKPSILDIYNYRDKDKFITEGRFFQSDIKPEDLAPKSKPVKSGNGLTTLDRQVLQITKSKNEDESPFIDQPGLEKIFRTFSYPLHFIDFETSAGRNPL